MSRTPSRRRPNKRGSRKHGHAASKSTPNKALISPPGLAPPNTSRTDVRSNGTSHPASHSGSKSASSTIVASATIDHPTDETSELPSLPSTSGLGSASPILAESGGNGGMNTTPSSMVLNPLLANFAPPLSGRDWYRQGFGKVNGFRRHYKFDIHWDRFIVKGSRGEVLHRTYLTFTRGWGINREVWVQFIEESASLSATKKKCLKRAKKFLSFLPDPPTQAPNKDSLNTVSVKESTKQAFDTGANSGKDASSRIEQSSVTTSSLDKIPEGNTKESNSRSMLGDNSTTTGNGNTTSPTKDKTAVAALSSTQIDLSADTATASAPLTLPDMQVSGTSVVRSQGKSPSSETTPAGEKEKKIGVMNEHAISAFADTNAAASADGWQRYVSVTALGEIANRVSSMTKAEKEFASKFIADTVDIHDTNKDFYIPLIRQVSTSLRSYISSRIDAWIEAVDQSLEIEGPNLVTSPELLQEWETNRNLELNAIESDLIDPESPFGQEWLRLSRERLGKFVANLLNPSPESVSEPQLKFAHVALQNQVNRAIQFAKTASDPQPHFTSSGSLQATFESQQMAPWNLFGTGGFLSGLTPQPTSNSSFRGPQFQFANNENQNVFIRGRPAQGDASGNMGFYPALDTYQLAGYNSFGSLQNPNIFTGGYQASPLSSEQTQIGRDSSVPYGSQTPQFKSPGGSYQPIQLATSVQSSQPPLSGAQSSATQPLTTTTNHPDDVDMADAVGADEPEAEAANRKGRSDNQTTVGDENAQSDGLSDENLAAATLTNTATPMDQDVTTQSPSSIDALASNGATSTSAEQIDAPGPVSTTLSQGGINVGQTITQANSSSNDTASGITKATVEDLTNTVGISKFGQTANNTPSVSTDSANSQPSLQTAQDTSRIDGTSDTMNAGNGKGPVTGDFTDDSTTDPTVSLDPPASSKLPTKEKIPGVSNIHELNLVCNTCFVANAALCLGCNRAAFCNENCQRNGWGGENGHKHNCKPKPSTASGKERGRSGSSYSGNTGVKTGPQKSSNTSTARSVPENPDSIPKAPPVKPSTFTTTSAPPTNPTPTASPEEPELQLTLSMKNYPDLLCGNCRKMDARYCRGCRVEAYCSLSCRDEKWSEHRLVCKSEADPSPGEKRKAPGLNKSRKIEQYCSHCGKPYARKCHGCYQESYCNILCQQAQWLTHEPRCKRLPKEEKSTEPKKASSDTPSEKPGQNSLSTFDSSSERKTSANNMAVPPTNSEFTFNLGMQFPFSFSAGSGSAGQFSFTAGSAPLTTSGTTLAAGTAASETSNPMATPIFSFPAGHVFQPTRPSATSPPPPTGRKMPPLNPRWDYSLRCECGDRAPGYAYECTGCDKVAYCDSECQKKDWPNHEPVCRK